MQWWWLPMLMENCLCCIVVVLAIKMVVLRSCGTGIFLFDCIIVGVLASVLIFTISIK